MGKVIDFLKNGHIQISLALGCSIIVLAYFSKRILPEPLSYLELNACALVLVAYDLMARSKKPQVKKYARPVLGVILIVITTAVVIIVNFM